MRYRKLVATGALAFAGLGIAVPASFARDDAPNPMQDVRAATRPYRDIDKAIADGYVQFFGCVHEPLAGSMGTHFVNAELTGDGRIEAKTPEALMYDAEPDGSWKLIGAEYVVFQAAWDAEHAEPPHLFGETFHLVAEPNRYGIPAYYELHAWAWKTNPTGAHADWNPTVLCPDTEGHTH